jgi:hypothetical protein
MYFRWLPITSLQSLFAEFVPARTDGAASELFFDRQLRVTTDVPPRLLRLLRSRAAPLGDQLISGSARLSEPRITALRGSPHSAEDTKRTGEAL